MPLTFDQARALPSAEKRRLLAELIPGSAAAPAQEEDAAARLRAEFIGDADVAYLNFGQQGPLPRAAADAVRDALDFARGEGLRPSAMAARMEHETRATRAAFAAALDAPEEAIALTESVSAGCALTMWGLGWRAGDHLLIADRENPGIVAAARELGRRLGVEVTEWPHSRVPEGEDPGPSLAEHLRPRTRLLIVSHVCWTTGRVADLAAIVRACRARGEPVRVLVDAAQSAGVLPREAGMDFCAFTAGKWWCGPAGVGGLYVHPDARDALRPTLAGWRAISVDERDGAPVWHPDARRYEAGSPPFALLPGVRAALRAHDAGGPGDERLRHIRALATTLRDGLAAIPGVTTLCDRPRAGIVSFTIEGRAPDEIAHALARRGIIVRAMHDPPCVRACVHHITARTEVDRLLDAVGTIRNGNAR